MLKGRFASINEFVSQRPLVVAIVSGAVACIFAASYLRSREASILRITEPVPVVVAAEDIEAGGIIDKEAVKLTGVPRMHAQPKSLGNIDEADGRAAVIKIERGAHLTEANTTNPKDSQSLSALIPAGERALAIPVGENIFTTALIKPNDRVDVIATFERGAERAWTTVVAQNLRVLAVGGRLFDSHAEFSLKNKKGGMFDSGPKLPSITQNRATITVAVTPNDATLLSAASESAVINISLRPRGDDGSLEQFAPVNAASLKGR